MPWRVASSGTTPATTTLPGAAGSRGAAAIADVIVMAPRSTSAAMGLDEGIEAISLSKKGFAEGGVRLLQRELRLLQVARELLDGVVLLGVFFHPLRIAQIDEHLLANLRIERGLQHRWRT